MPVTFTTTLAAPSNTTLDTSVEDEITVSWTDNSSAEDGYYVYRSQDGSTFSQVADLAANTTSWTDTGKEDGEKYWYYVEAYTSGGETSAGSTVSGITVLPSPTSPSLDTSVEDEITVSWTNNDDSTDGTIEVYRSTDGSLGTSVASFSTLSTTSHTDTGLNDGEKYYYTVRRVTDHTSADSSQVSGITVNPADSALSLSSASDTALDVSWTDNHNNEDGRRVYYSDDGGSTWTQFSDLGANTTSETITGLSQDTNYDVKTEVYTEHVSSESGTDGATTYLDVSRDVSSHINPISMGITRLADYNRQPLSHSNLISSPASRVVNLDRPISSYSSSSSSLVSRIINLDRPVSSHSKSVSSFTNTIINLNQLISSHSNPISSPASRVVNLDRPINSYSKPVSSSNDRIVDLNRTVNSVSGPIHSFIFNERTSLEVIDYDIEWDDEKSVWYTPWVQEDRVLGDEDRFVLKASVVDDAKDPTALIAVQYDKDGNGSINEQSDFLHVGYDEEIHEVDDIPISEDGWYRLKITEYSGYNSLYSLNMGIVH